MSMKYASSQLVLTAADNVDPEGLGQCSMLCKAGKEVPLQMERSSGALGTTAGSEPDTKPCSASSRPV